MRIKKQCLGVDPKPDYHSKLVNLVDNGEIQRKLKHHNFKNYRTPRFMATNRYLQQGQS